MRYCTVTTFGEYSRFAFYSRSTRCSGSRIFAGVSREASDYRQASVVRSRRMVEQLFYSNKFRYFVTLTVAPGSGVQRNDLSAVKQKLTRVLNRLTKLYSCKYLLVPDFHADGSIHFHGFFDICDEALRRCGSFRLFKQGARAPKFYSPLINRLLGRNDFRPLFRCFGKSSCNYVLKYVTKAADLVRGDSSQALYIRSRGLQDYTFKEVFKGEDVPLIMEALVVNRVSRRFYDYGVTVCPYVDEPHYEAVFTLFYSALGSKVVRLSSFKRFVRLHGSSLDAPGCFTQVQLAVSSLPGAQLLAI